MSEAERQRLLASADDPVALFVATGGERMLRVVVWAILGILACTNLLQYLHNGQFTAPTLLVAFVGVLLLTLALLNQQHFQAAFSLFLWSLLLGGIGSAFTVSGFQTPGLLFVPTAVKLATWLLRRRQVVAMVLVSFAGFLLIAFYQSEGSLPSESRTPLFWALAFSSAVLTSVLLGLAMSGGIRHQYRRAVLLSDELAKLNRDLEEKVSARTAELETALQHLRQTQDDLIQSEKLASLGSMVAGIAHELNTPIGNTLTVSSAMCDRSKTMAALLESGAMKKSDLTHGLAAIDEMASLIDRSANRLAALVASFKQVAVDQVSERRRAFDLSTVIEENLAALRPGLKLKPWTIHNRVPVGIPCDSFPGPLGQVITNLIQNAIMHGFQGRDHGTIEISAQINDGIVELHIADDGVGMDTATSVRVFEPFYTTKLGRGGSGLGLAICFRIASTILAGDIRVQSSSGTGTQFIVRFPARTPGKI